MAGSERITVTIDAHLATILHMHAEAEGVPFSQLVGRYIMAGYRAHVVEAVSEPAAQEALQRRLSRAAATTKATRTTLARRRSGVA